MRVVVYDRYTKQLCKDSPDTLFVFGDNVEGFGLGGTACIRMEPNAIGICTKWRPRREEVDYFDDSPECVHAVLEDLSRLAFRMRSGFNCVAFPRGGIGTGLAELPSRAPKLYGLLTDALRLGFGYAQPHGEGL